jgi:DNA-binding NtrC family response regulator
MRLLIIGKLHGYIGEASKIAMLHGALVTHVESIDVALVMLRSGKGADLIMIDVALDIAKLNAALVSERFAIPIIACGVGTETAPAVRAIHAGAKEYLPLPPDAELIAAILETVAKDDQTFLAQDPAMRQVIKLADHIAPSEANVLITGESGTGKEVMARYIHRKSRRHRAPFISINCAAIPENLLESELFGHEKGAFTGAIARRIGKFEEANGGTLLLDEVTEMHPVLQAKLLRAIQEREIDRVGGSKPIKVNIRILATSNRNVEKAVQEGQFREDLYFRLNVVSISLPPLRERPLDIEMLAEHFIQKYAKLNAVPPRPLSQEARDILRQHLWRGNIRELENTIHRAVLLATEDEIDANVLQLCGLQKPGSANTYAIHADSAAMYAGSAAIQAGSAGQTVSPVYKNQLVGRTVSEVEKDLILGTLDYCLGNRTQAAHILGISIRTLRNKLKQYALEQDALEKTVEAMETIETTEKGVDKENLSLSA